MWNSKLNLLKEKRRNIGIVGALMLLFGLTLYGPGHMLDSISVSNSVDGRELPIYCVQTDKPEIALTFDAAWGNEDTEQIMEILKKQNVQVTFFMTGGWVEKYPEDVKMILAAGHDLGNHSENHKNMSQISDDEKRQEIMKVHNKVKELTDYEMFLFRPPYGDYNNAVVTVARECNYYSIQWDCETYVTKVINERREIFSFFIDKKKECKQPLNLNATRSRMGDRL